MFWLFNLLFGISPNINKGPLKDLFLQFSHSNFYFGKLRHINILIKLHCVRKEE
ncbi:MAG TPA: hypothetical protein ENF31_00570 [bacterium]|nr:hypothetical protein [bacterium]